VIFKSGRSLLPTARHLRAGMVRGHFSRPAPVLRTGALRGSGPSAMLREHLGENERGGGGA
jgi:hypothetical protein